MKELIINIADRKLINMQDLKDAFTSLKDGRHLVIIKDARKRSIPQNAYYWSVVVPAVRRGLYDAGYDEVKTNDDAHEVLKHVHLRKRIVSKQTGDVIDIAGSSAKLTIPEFNDYIEEICKWSAEFFNVVIPSPNQEFMDFEDHTQQLAEAIVEE